MSSLIGFPLAPANTGLSSAIYAKVQVRFRSRRCTGTASGVVPDYWIETINYADTLGSLPFGLLGKGTFVCKDDSLALFNSGGTTPTNQTTLHSLAVQLATDILSWRSVSHDITFNGIIASPPNGIMDTCEWKMTTGEITTRQITEPINFSLEEFQHNDGTNNALCADVSGQLSTTKTPCIETYIPKWDSGTIMTYRARICLEDGRLIEYYNTSDPLACGCKGNQCVTNVAIFVRVCDSADISGIAMTLKDNLGTTVCSGTYTFGTMPATFLCLNIACDNSKTYTVNISKTGFNTINQVLSYMCCIGGVFNFFLVKTTNPTITVNFHVQSCRGTSTPSVNVPPFACAQCGSLSAPGISGVTVGVTVNGVFHSCTTNANGDCTISFPSFNRLSSYPVSASGGACVLPYVHDQADDIIDLCKTQTFGRCINLPVDAACQCLCCEQPHPATLNLADSLYGNITLTYQLLPDGIAFGYAAIGVGLPFAGGCNCPPVAVTVNYFFSCGCTASGGTCGITSNCSTLYGLTICFSIYQWVSPVCINFPNPPFIVVKSCPGPIDPMHPGNAECGPFGIPGGADCGDINKFHALVNGPSNLSNSTAGCQEPLNVVFSRTNSCGGNLACGLTSNNCPTPWPGNATWTVTV